MKKILFVDDERMKGKSTKSEKKMHGVFLKTITDPSIKNLFNFEVKIDRMDKGTRVKIKF